MAVELHDLILLPLAIHVSVEFLDITWHFSFPKSNLISWFIFSFFHSLHYFIEICESWCVEDINMLIFLRHWKEIGEDFSKINLHACLICIIDYPKSLNCSSSVFSRQEVPYFLVQNHKMVFFSQIILQIDVQILVVRFTNHRMLFLFYYVIIINWPWKISASHLIIADICLPLLQPICRNNIKLLVFSDVHFYQLIFFKKFSYLVCFILKLLWSSGLTHWASNHQLVFVLVVIELLMPMVSCCFIQLRCILTCDFENVCFLLIILSLKQLFAKVS